jgi:branched-chain amino acid transport system substrate-binding protein
MRATYRMRMIGTGGAVLAIALAASACGSSSGSSGGASGGLPSTIKLSAVQDLTGVAGTQGSDTKDGMQVAVDEINATGFLGHSKLSISYADDTSSPTNGASLMSQAASGSAPIVFGSISSSVAVAEAPIAQRDKAPTIFTQAGSQGVVSAGDYIYRATPLQTTYLHLTGQFIQQRGYKKLGMITVTDVPTIVSIAAWFQQNAKKYGYSIVDEEQATSATTEFSTQITKILSKKPDAILVFGLSGQNPTAVTQLRTAGYTGPIIGQQGMGGGVLSPLGSSANNIYWATDFSPSQQTKGALAFEQAYAKYGSGTPNNFGAEGYDAVWLAARALKDAGSVDRAKVLAGLAKVAAAGFEGALGNVTFVDRSEIAPGVLVQWSGGKEALVK